MSPPHERGRPGGYATRTAQMSNAKDYEQNTRVLGSQSAPIHSRRPTLHDLIAPFRGQHNCLRGGWDEPQLHTVAESLGVTNRSIAMVGCSLVAEERATGMPLRYSRSQKTYSYLVSCEGDPLMTYRRVVPAVDWLIENGYAEGHKGLWLFGKQSIVRATPKLMALVGPLVNASHRHGAMLKDEIILRDTDGHAVGFIDTDEVRQMRRDMKMINARLASQRYVVGSTEMSIPPAARVFNQTFRRGGRLYHQGSSYQQMPKRKRAQIKMLLDDGEVSPTVELDYASLHMNLLYRRAGKRCPDRDLYAIEGYTRSLVKVATLISINADGNEVGAVAQLLSEDEDVALDNGFDYRCPAALRAAAERLVAAIKRKHYRVREYFGSGAGAELMKVDSDMAVAIMLSMIEKTGRCPLVVHDSFLVPEVDADVLQAVMAKAIARVPKGHPGNNPASPPIHLGKHSTDQQEHDSLCESLYVLEVLFMIDTASLPPPWRLSGLVERRERGRWFTVGALGLT